MKLLQPSTLCALFMFFTASASAQLMDDPQLYKMWSDEFGDPNVGFNKPTYNLNGTETSNDQMYDYLNPYWDFTNDDGWCKDLVATDVIGTPTSEVSYGTLKINMVNRPIPVVVNSPKYCGGDIVPGGQRKLKYDTEIFTSRKPTQHKFDYGHYSLKFKLPPSVNGSSDGIQFSWYAYAQDVVAFRRNDEGLFYPTQVGWAEIDFIEYSGEQDRFTHNYLFGFNDKNDEEEFAGGWPKRYMNQINFYELDYYQRGVPFEEYADFRKSTDQLQVPDEEGYHTMSCEVTPQKITWYMDGKYLQSTVGQRNVEASLPFLPKMSHIIGLHSPEGFDSDLSGSKWNDTIMPSTVLPYTAEIDYLRFNKFTCDVTADRIENTTGPMPVLYTFADLSGAVYRRVALAPYTMAPGTPPRLTASDGPLIIRAAEYAELLPGFEVEMGGELYIDVHDCYE
jgi:hypothetical protein